MSKKAKKQIDKEARFLAFLSDLKKRGFVVMHPSIGLKDWAYFYKNNKVGYVEAHCVLGYDFNTRPKSGYKENILDRYVSTKVVNPDYRDAEKCLVYKEGHEEWESLQEFKKTNSWNLIEL